MMCELLVEGGERLYGELTIQGSKNSVLPILAATLLCADTCVIENCPKLRDVDASVAILRHLGCCTHWEDSALVVDTARMDRAVVPDALMREMRSSVIFLGAILARCKEATICYPGGCELGPRPIDLHLSALSALGAEIRETGGELKCRGGTLLGSDVYLPMPSVGATENALLCACGADGVTTIYNAAREPEIEDLANFLNKMGAKITVDCATLMNKGLEVIEAMRLYRLPLEQVDVVIHRQSIVHSMVEFTDGAVMAQMGTPDMRLPIQLALTYPERIPSPVERLDLLSCGPLTFSPPDTENFPCLALARDCAKASGTACPAMNGANEEAVAMFLNDKIGFYDIYRLVNAAVPQVPFIADPTLEQILEADRLAREAVRANS